MSDLIEFQMSLSTAEEEENYFAREPVPVCIIDPSSVMPAGVYRVIADQLHRILPGIPLAIPLRTEEPK